MTDGGPAAYTPLENGYDPADHVDRAIIATRVAVFPDHGLDPRRHERVTDAQFREFTFPGLCRHGG